MRISSATQQYGAVPRRSVRILVVLLLVVSSFAGCEPRMIPPADSPLHTSPEVLPYAEPDTLEVSDTLYTVMSAAQGSRHTSPMRRIKLTLRESLGTSIPLLRSIQVLRSEPSLPAFPTMESLRPYLKFVSKLEVEASYAPLERIPGYPRRLSLRKPLPVENTLLPTVIYESSSGLELTAPVEKALEDSYGRVWILTQNALLCWGGSHVEALTVEEGLPTQSITDGLWEERTGRLWFCGAQGIAAWDGRQYLRLPLGSDIQRVLGLTLGPVLYLRVRTASLHDAPLYGWRQDTLYRWYSPVEPLGIYPVLADSVGVWCNLHDGKGVSIGLVRGDTLWRLEGWEDKSTIQSLLYDSKGQIWLAGRRGLWRWEKGHAKQIVEGPTAALTTFTDGSLVCLHRGYMRYVDRDTLYAVITGLPEVPLDYAFRRHAGEWLLFSQEGWVAIMESHSAFTLPMIHFIGQKDWVFAIQNTESGDLWIGLEQKGLLRLASTGEVERYEIPQGTGFLPIGEISLLQRRDTLVWLSWYAEGRRQGTPIWLSTKEIPEKPLYSEGWLDRHTDINGWVWLAHPEGIGVAHLGERRPLYRLSLHPTSSFLRDKRGWLWFGAQGELYAWTGRHLLRWKLPGGDGFILALAEDQAGRLWIGTNGDGLYCMEDNRWLHWTQRHGLGSNLIVQIAPTDSGIWLGTSDGLAYLRPEERKMIILRSGAGLGGNSGANGGIFRSPHIRLDRPALNGILSRGTWLCGAGAAVVGFTGSGAMAQAPPRPYIGGIEIAGKPIPTNDSLKWWDSLITAPFALPTGLRLPYERNSLTFILAHGGAFAREAGVEYRLYLEGLDDSWAPPSAGHRVEYRRLPPGRYTLHIIARYPDSEWSAPVSYTFLIEAPWWLSPWAFIGYGSLLIGLIWGIVRWRTAVLRQRARELAIKVQEATATIREQNARLQAQNQQLAEQNLLISAQKEEIENKNRSLLESITYARRIQAALLPSEEALMRRFSESFVFWKPRDIVSGDIYALYIDPADPNAFYLLVADCTGHGVPGAFVSLMSLTLLNRTLTEYRLTDPADILSAVSLQLTTLLQPDTPGHVRDGFEGVLVRFNRGGKIQYAAARSPFWLVRRGEIIEQPYDPIPVGPPDTVRQIQTSFKSYALETNKGDWLYFASDGFADQLGGERGRKYGYKAFRQLLLRLSGLPAADQKAALDYELLKWQGAYPQVDDILIVGIQIGT